MNKELKLMSEAYAGSEEFVEKDGRIGFFDSKGEWQYCGETIERALRDGAERAEFLRKNPIIQKVINHCDWRSMHD